MGNKGLWSLSPSHQLALDSCARAVYASNSQQVLVSVEAVVRLMSVMVGHLGVWIECNLSDESTLPF